MVAELTKIIKSDGAPVDEVEKSVAIALKELESTEKSIAELYIVGAKELDFGGKKCIVIYVPVPQLKQFQKVHEQITRNLEKKFGGTHIVFVAKRRILPKPQRGKKFRPSKQVRTRSRTLTTVHEAILNDLVFPAEVVGKRIRVKLDGKKLMKVHLDKSQENFVGHKVETFTQVYKSLTGKDAVFEFQAPLF
uniref:40S ribosomal protein S7 n=1 Tax=Parastrongyloides trichosuri TaxID=131310 RepID=A0A0N4ZSE9_PARTI